MLYALPLSTSSDDWDQSARPHLNAVALWVGRPIRSLASGKVIPYIV